MLGSTAKLNISITVESSIGQLWFRQCMVSETIVERSQEWRRIGRAGSHCLWPLLFTEGPCMSVLHRRARSILSSTFPAKCPPEGTHIPQKTTLKEECKDQNIFLAANAESLNAKQGVTEMCGNKDLYDRSHVNYPIPTCEIVHNWGNFPSWSSWISAQLCADIHRHTLKTD